MNTYGVDKDLLKSAIFFDSSRDGSDFLTMPAFCEVLRLEDGSAVYRTELLRNETTDIPMSHPEKKYWH